MCALINPTGLDRESHHKKIITNTFLNFTHPYRTVTFLEEGHIELNKFRGAIVPSVREAGRYAKLSFEFDFCEYYSQH